jgi:hypothetical protein
MRFEQRAMPESVEAADAVGLWLRADPDRLGAWSGLVPEGFEPSASDWYVTVDERVSGVVGLVASRWPRSDDQGRPRFEGPIETAWVDGGTLQRVVDDRRAEVGELERPLRIGDTFAVRAPELGVPEQWEAAWDVTKAARAAAKAAVATVTVGAVDRPQRFFEFEGADAVVVSEPPPPPPSVAGPTVASPAV